MSRLSRFIHFYTDEDEGNGGGGDPGILKTVTGALLHITDALAKPAHKFTATLEPIQDLHGQDAPWPAGGGKNLLDPNAKTTSSTNIYYYQTNGISLKAGTYTISTSQTAAGIYVKEYGSSTNLFLAYNKAALTFTLTNDNVCWFDIYFSPSVPTGTSEQLESGSSATSFAPYENLCPITGWTGVDVMRTGKNLLNIDRTLSEPIPTDISNTTSPRVFNTTKYYEGVRSDNYYYKNYITAVIESGTVSVTLKGGNNSYGAGFPVGVIGGGTYTFSANFTNGHVSFGYYDSSWNYISNSITFESNATVTVPSDAAFMLIVLRTTAVGATATFTNLQLELGSIASSYEAYQGTTIPITFPDAAGTVYGATIDLVRNKLVVTHGYIAKNTADMDNNDRYPGWKNSGIQALVGNINTRIDGSYSNISPQTTPSNPYIAASGDILILGSGANAFGKTQTEWIALAMDVQVVVPLATPIEYDLTETQALTLLKGENVVWCDNSDDLELTYYAKADS